MPSSNRVPPCGIRAHERERLARDQGGKSVNLIFADGFESFELHVTASQLRFVFLPKE